MGASGTAEISPKDFLLPFVLIWGNWKSFGTPKKLAKMRKVVAVFL